MQFTIYRQRGNTLIYDSFKYNCFCSNEFRLYKLCINTTFEFNRAVSANDILECMKDGCGYDRKCLVLKYRLLLYQWLGKGFGK